MDNKQNFNPFGSLFGNGFMDAYKRTSKYKDSAMMEVYMRRQEFEKRLDEMWANCSKNIKQYEAYHGQIQIIKEAGLIVQRSKSTGKHRIVLPK